MTARSGADSVARNYDPVVDSARKHRQAGKPDLAIPLLETVRKAEPENAEAWRELGLSLVALGHADGLRMLESALALDRTNAALAADLGEVRLGIGDVARAVAHLHAATALAPDDAPLLLRIAKAFSRADRLPDAEALIGRAQSIRPRFGEAHVLRGMLLYRSGRLQDAMQWFHRSFVEDPSYTEGVVALVSTLQEAGAPPELVLPMARIAAERLPNEPSVVIPVVQLLRDIGEEAESIRFASPLIRHQMDQVAKDEIGRFGIRVLKPDVMLDRIGELAFQLDLHVKMKLLGWLPPCISILLAPRERIVNRSFLEYWRPYISIVEDPAHIAALAPLADRVPFNPVYVALPDGRAMSKNRAYFAVQEEWQRQGRGALLDLTRRHMERGAKEMRRLGVPEGSWFVCVHARESGYMKELGPSSEMARNADINAYLPAIREITRRGGWVVRLGDASMTPLPKLERVIDYALSDAKSDWMDVYLTASCRFVLGTTSGISLVASMFGVPISAANFFPIGERLHTSSDVWIPKLVRERASGRVLSFDECLSMPLALTYDAQRLPAKGLEALDSAPEDILSLAVEMLDRADGSAVYSEEEESLQRRWDQLCESFAPGHVGSRVGRGFLMRHRHLFRPF